MQANWRDIKFFRASEAFGFPYIPVHELTTMALIEQYLGQKWKDNGQVLNVDDIMMEISS